MSIEDLLKGILGGADSQARGQQAGGDPLSDLLRGILGGMAAPQADSGQAGAGALPDLLGTRVRSTDLPSGHRRVAGRAGLG